MGRLTKQTTEVNDSHFSVALMISAEICYISISSRWCSLIESVIVYRGVGCSSDHSFFIANAIEIQKAKESWKKRFLTQPS